VRRLIKIGFVNRGFRGKEILLYRPKQEKRKIGDKDYDTKFNK
jgi:hypothetical protein